MRVVDFSTHLSGPLASHLLVETGADVIKVEHPVVGDGNRGMSPKINGVGDFHVGLNSGARSITASTRSPHWPQLVEACARWADAIIVGARPSDARRRGIDFATMAKHNDRLVYTLISGYGIRGPWEEYPAHGQNIDALAGQVPYTIDGDRVETGAGWRSAGTTMAGVFAALGTVAAVQKRDEVGHAQFVHVSIWQSAMWWKWRDLNDLANLGEPWPEYRDLGPRYSLYRTSDGGVILLCPLEERFWKRFAELIGLTDQQRDRGSWNRDNAGMDYGYDGEYELIAKKIATKTRDKWVALLEPLDVPFAPILDLKAAMDSEHAAANELFRTSSVGGKPVRVVASPVQLHLNPEGPSEPLAPIAPPPSLGEQSDDILKELGLSAIDLDDLRGTEGKA
jgi:crotonobetainyl-CoA:carnitine CoA-transferase CaiB-like acyl-CoA transferase